MAVCAVLLWVAIKHCPSSASSVTGFWGGASAGVGARQLPGSASRFGSAATLLILLLPSHSTDSNANGSFKYTKLKIQRHEIFFGQVPQLPVACLSSANDSALILTCRSEVWVFDCENNLFAKHKTQIQDPGLATASANFDQPTV